MSRNLLFLYQELGPSRHFPFAAGARSPEQLQNNITSLYDLWCSHATTPSASTFHLDADGFLTFPIQASIEEVVHVQTLRVPWATPKPLLNQGDVLDNAPLKLPYLLAHIFDWGVLEHSRIRTSWATHSLWPCTCDSYFMWVGGIPNARGPHPH